MSETTENGYEYCRIFHVGDEIAIVYSYLGFKDRKITFGTISKVNKTTYKVEGRLFRKDTLEERGTHARWSGRTSITIVTQELKDENARQKYLFFFTREIKFDNLPLSTLRKMYKVYRAHIDESNEDKDNNG